MPPQLVVHHTVPPVLHPVALPQAPALQGVGHGEAKGEGVDRQGLRGVAVEEAHGILLPLRHGEGGGAAEAVGGDGPGDAVQQVAAVLQPGDNGEQQGSPPGPDRRIPLPQILRSLLIPDGGQLSPPLVNHHRQFLIFDAYSHGVHSFSLFCFVRVLSHDIPEREKAQGDFYASCAIRRKAEKKRRRGQKVRRLLNLPVCFLDRTGAAC